MAAMEENDILNITDEEIKRIIDPNNTMAEIKKSDLVLQNDPDYFKKGGITLDQYTRRREIFLKVKNDFGDDPLFYNVFGTYDYANAIQFLKMSDALYVIEQTPYKEIKDIILRNEHIGTIYKRLKQRIKDLRKLKEKNIEFNIIDNGEFETTAQTVDISNGSGEVCEQPTSPEDD